MAKVNIKAKYLAEMREHVSAEEIERARGKIANSDSVSRAASRRKKFGTDEKIFSVPAGVLMLVVIIFYSFNLSTVAGIAAILLFAYMVFVVGMILYKRAALRRTPLEIDPRESLTALFAKALGLKTDARIEPLLGDVAALGADVKALCDDVARENGVSVSEWKVDSQVNLKQLVSEQRDVIKLPCAVTLTGKSADGDLEITLEYLATFAGNGDDFLIVDTRPEILGRVKLSALVRAQGLSAVTWDGDISDRWKALNQ